MGRYQKDKSPTENLYLALFSELPSNDMEENDLPCLLEILNALTPREGKVIKMSYGIAVPMHSCVQIGDEFNVTGKRIREIQQKALRKLRHPCHSLPIKALFASRATLRNVIAEKDNQLAEAETQISMLKIALAKREVSLATKMAKVRIQCEELLSVLPDPAKESGFHDPRYISITSIDFSVRTFNCLESAEIKTLGELAAKSPGYLKHLRNFGKLCLDEVVEKLAFYGLSLSDSD